MRHGLSFSNGFTLIELLLVIALTAIIATLAVDGQAPLRARHRLALLGQQLVGQLHHARSDALRTNRPVYLCALNAKSNLDLQGCLATRRQGHYVWDEGALAYADNPLAAGNRPARYDSGERLRAVQFGDGIAVAAPVRQLVFGADGRLAEPAVFRLRDLATGLCRSVRVSGAGRARVCTGGEAGCDVC